MNKDAAHAVNKEFIPLVMGIYGFPHDLSKDEFKKWEKGTMQYKFAPHETELGRWGADGGCVERLKTCEVHGKLLHERA